MHTKNIIKNKKSSTKVLQIEVLLTKLVYATPYFIYTLDIFSTITVLSHLALFLVPLMFFIFKDIFNIIFCTLLNLFDTDLKRGSKH